MEMPIEITGAGSVVISKIGFALGMLRSKLASSSKGHGLVEVAQELFGMATVGFVAKFFLARCASRPVSEMQAWLTPKRI